MCRTGWGRLTPQNFVDELIVELSSEKDALENMVHEKLEEFRIVNGDGATEFFNCTVGLAKETVKRLAKKKFMPKGKRNSKDAYQGPKYFTFKGELLTDLWAKLGK